MNARNKAFKGLKGLTLTGTIAVLVACGGGGGSDDDDNVISGSSPVVARGVITQLGSMYVNGVKYELPADGKYSSDDDNPSGSDVAANLVYQVGQVVSLYGSIDDNGVTGRAEAVEYEAEIEGTAQSGAINGISILLSPTINATGATLDMGDLKDGERYEVSGVWISDSLLEATFIKDDDDTGIEDEIKGKVQAVDPGVSFDVHGITFNFTGTPVGGTSINLDELVEVHFNPGTCLGTPPNISPCTATRVEIEDDFLDRAEEWEIEGGVDKTPTDCPAEAEFKVDGVCVDSSTKPAEWLDGLDSIDDLVQGSRVEVEGHKVSVPSSPTAIKEYLRADKVKGRGNRVRVTSTANVPGTGSADFDLLFGAIQVTIVSGITEIEPSVGTITDGEGLEVRGVRTGANSMMALRIKSESVSADRHELRAEVDLGGADSGNDTITVMGVSSEATFDTQLEIDDVNVGPGGGSTTDAQINTFLDMIDDDDIVSPTNGPRDVIEVRIDTTSGSGTLTPLFDPYPARQIEIEEEDD